MNINIWAWVSSWRLYKIIMYHNVKETATPSTWSFCNILCSIKDFSHGQCPAIAAENMSYFDMCIICWIYVYMYICIYIYMYIYVYICIYIYMYIYVYIYMNIYEYILIWYIIFNHRSIFWICVLFKCLIWCYLMIGLSFVSSIFEKANLGLYGAINLVPKCIQFSNTCSNLVVKLGAVNNCGPKNQFKSMCFYLFQFFAKFAFMKRYVFIFSIVDYKSN